MPRARAILEKPAGLAPFSAGASSGMSISSTTTARSCFVKTFQRIYKYAIQHHAFFLSVSKAECILGLQPVLLLGIMKNHIDTVICLEEQDGKGSTAVAGASLIAVLEDLHCYGSGGQRKATSQHDRRGACHPRNRHGHICHRRQCRYHLAHRALPNKPCNSRGRS